MKLKFEQQRFFCVWCEEDYLGGKMKVLAETSGEGLESLMGKDANQCSSRAIRRYLATQYVWL